MNFQIAIQAVSIGTASLSGLVMRIRCAPGGSAGATTFSVFMSTTRLQPLFRPSGNVGAILKSAAAQRESCAVSQVALAGLIVPNPNRTRERAEQQSGTAVRQATENPLSRIWHRAVMTLRDWVIQRTRRVAGDGTKGNKAARRTDPRRLPAKQ